MDSSDHSNEVAAIALTSGLIAHKATSVAAFLGNIPISQEIRSSAPSYITPLQKLRLKNLALSEAGATMSRAKAFGRNHSPRLASILDSAGPVFLPKQPRVGVKRPYVQNTGSKNFHTLVHELGHAKDFSVNTKSKVALGRLGMAMSKGIRPLGVGTAALLNEDTAPYAPLVPLVAAIPSLRAEVAANIQGHNYLKRVNASSAGKNRFLQVAAKNLLGYISPVAAGSAILEIGAQARKHYSQSS